MSSSIAPTVSSASSASSVISQSVAPTSTSTSIVSVPVTTTVQSVTTAAPTTSLSTLAPSTSVVSVAPSTSVVVTSVPPATTIVTEITSIFTQTPTNPGQTNNIVTTITSTQPVLTITPTNSQQVASSQTSARTSSSQSALSAAGSNGASQSGLGSPATIAIAVIIPIAAVIGLIIFGLWFWRRRKAKKNAEELRKNEMAEYGFNPNHDPTLPVAAAAYTEPGSDGNDDSGYRGWGATTASNRKASTTLGSNSRAAALAGVGGGMSDHGSQGYAPQPSPSAGGSDGMSQDPLVHGYPDAATTGLVGGAALAAGAAAGSRSKRHSQTSAPSGIHRGPSNASSAYSGIAHSDASSDVPDMPRPYYEQEIPYNVYNDVQPGQGAYGDGIYGTQNEEPIIRDVQARRNTRIERAPTFPQQGGIAQNF